MMVKDGFFFTLALIASVVLLFSVAERAWFLANAERASGAIIDVRSENDRCRSGRARPPCTKYYAYLRYQVGGQDYFIRITAGQKRGHLHPLSFARYRKGDTVAVVYRVGNPDRAYRDERTDVWGTPFMIFVAQMALFVAAFSGKRRA